MTIKPEDLRGTTARPHIDINDEGDVEYWAHRLGVSRDELVQAVLLVGDVADDVARALSRSSSPRSDEDAP
jgi:hypothetical protein